ncbi:MAG TPA: hypothetical protein VN958_01415, partial [Chitinophagaceae bacterium]|nr:hypothetical protein [Chitinophagaceae bacterium]
YPYSTEDGSLIVLKNTYRDIPAIFKLNTDKTETKITVRDIAYDDYFSYNNNKIVYAAYQADVRWGNRDFSIIKMHDVNTGEEKRISSHTKYFSPDISHNGKTIAAVEIKENLRSDIVVMNEDGIVSKRFTSNNHIIYSYPKFSADDQFLYVMIRNDKGDMGIEKRNINDGNTTIILPLKNHIIGFPLVKGDTLLYSCSNNGRDEIWAYVNKQNKNYRLASYATGLYQATFAEDGKLVSAAFTSSGYRLAKFNAQWQPVDLNDTLTSLYVLKPFNEKYNALLESVPLTHYRVTKYPKLFHPFNFHSWSPYLDYPNYSFNIYGQNILNTLQSQLYYNYNDDEKYHRVGYTAIYGGWYLQPFLDINQTWNRNGLTDSGSVKWNEFNASAGLSLPLNFSKGRQYRNLTFFASYNVNNIQWKTNSKKLLNDLNYVNLRLFYAGQIQKAPDQIYPHWAQSLRLQYRASATSITAHQLLASGSFYLPGFAKTHSLVLNGAFQARDTAGKYFFTNNFPFSRGYEAIDLPRVWKIGANYHFPLWHPDWGFANVVYFLRVRANVFYDYTEAKSLRTDTHYKFRSYGAE